MLPMPDVGAGLEVWFVQRHLFGYHFTVRQLLLFFLFIFCCLSLEFIITIIIWKSKLIYCKGHLYPIDILVSHHGVICFLFDFKFLSVII